MEKYIFDCRQDQSQSPKYLKRNHKVESMQKLRMPSSNKSRNKVILKFDYSYYQTVPKTASLHLAYRIRDLNYLVDHCESTHQKNQVFLQKQVNHAFEKSKWKKQKQNRMKNRDFCKRDYIKFGKKKIRMPVDSKPSVGDYHCQPTLIQKRIVYDVKLRGKPSTSVNHISRRLDRQSKTGSIEVLQPGSCMRQEKSSTTVQRDYGPNTKRLDSEDDYIKFISSIETASVWGRLMQKYRLKGTKFDTPTYV